MVVVGEEEQKEEVQVELEGGRRIEGEGGCVGLVQFPSWSCSKFLSKVSKGQFG